jgi:hypothetical protein
VDSRLVGLWADATVIAHQFDPARGSDPIAKEAIVRLPVDTSAMTLVAMYGDQGEVLAVKVAGEPAGIRPGGAVEVAGLVAQPWELGDRFGVSYRAAAIRPAEVAKGGERVARTPSAASTS